MAEKSDLLNQVATVVKSTIPIFIVDHFSSVKEIFKILILTQNGLHFIIVLQYKNGGYYEFGNRFIKRADYAAC